MPHSQTPHNTNEKQCTMAKQALTETQGKERAESQQFDKIIRQNMPVLFPALMEKVFGLHIVEYTLLDDKLQTTKQLEVDALQKATDAEGNTFIIHLEVQTKNDKYMAIRLLEYRAMLNRIHGLLVKQYVLYIGGGNMNMQDCIIEPDLQFAYKLIDFSTLPHEWFLSSEHIEEQLLAVLGKLGDKEPTKLMEEVISAIDRQPINRVAKIKYFKQLRVLAQLRKFTDTKKVRDMMLKTASFFKVEKDPFYKQGAEEAAEQKSYEFVQNLIQSTEFDDAKIASLAVVAVSFVEKVRDNLNKKKK